MLTSLEHLLPSTIHPMVVHFTIAVAYLAGVSGLVGGVRQTPFWSRAFLYLLLLGLVATGAAAVAGVVSESYLPRIPQAVAPMLHTHKEDALFTAVFQVVALALQLALGTRRQRVSWLAVISTLLACAFVTLAGHLGGTMVYHYGLGVKA
ncbi:DUF2231 domain-containing protein [Alicyclobacillus vulcanalis]|uniref:Uncharacterized membrane protein n=1 Tax=Alicyclobacillus vulcanalis TaxID=252246 RepID=A0A1N7KXU4_9BACL|nr:DUF2231 domain-containing protein [Alicyclobacillus vulcanalis]SIS66429.1 Uncharacterized membrane protein [Alicyclobacillus vulcanalis]